MNPLLFFYHQLADQFLALGTQGDTKTPLDEKRLEEIRANFKANPKKDGPPFVPGGCNVLTTYIPVKDKRLVKFLSETVEKITPLFPTDMPYYVVPPSTYHMSLVMIQDIRPVDMDNEEMKKAALSKEEVGKVARLFVKELKKRKLEKYDLRLYGILFAPSDGSMLAVFEDDCQTCRLRAEIAGALQKFRRQQTLKYSKGLLHVTLLRPLAQLSPDLLGALQDKQRELFRSENVELTLPVRKIALGRERVWMHTKVEELQRVKLR